MQLPADFVTQYFQVFREALIFGVKKEKHKLGATYLNLVR